jgi:hypothetical protein
LIPADPGAVRPWSVLLSASRQAKPCGRPRTGGGMAFERVGQLADMRAERGERLSHPAKSLRERSHLMPETGPDMLPTQGAYASGSFPTGQASVNCQAPEIRKDFRTCRTGDAYLLCGLRRTLTEQRSCPIGLSHALDQRRKGLPHATWHSKPHTDQHQMPTLSLTAHHRRPSLAYHGNVPTTFSEPSRSHPLPRRPAFALLPPRRSW